MKLNFLLFGNGNGLGSPYFDGRFYWLVDTYQKQRCGKNGQFYVWRGGFGAQLCSFEWLTPKPGTRRKLFGYEFKPFNVYRRLFKVCVSWEICGYPLDDYEQILNLQRILEVNNP